MDYIVYTERPSDFELKDGSVLSAQECNEGWFILKSQSNNAELAGWDNGTETNSITNAEPSVDI